MKRNGPLKDDFERERRELLGISAKAVEMQTRLEKRGGKIEGASHTEPQPETVAVRDAQRPSAAEQPQELTEESQQAQAVRHEQEKALGEEKPQQELTEHQRFAMRFLEQEARRAQYKEESEGESM